MEPKYLSAFQAHEDLKMYDINSVRLILFALELRFDLDDITTIAAESITDGNDDKGIDMVYIDLNSGHTVIAQGYFPAPQNMAKPEAPASKAASLNQAPTWLFAKEINELPMRLQEVAKSLRSALKNGQIKTIEFWYVHPLPESGNVTKDLRAVESTAHSVLRQNYPDSQDVTIRAIEIGSNTLERLYLATETPIVVNELFELDLSMGGYEISGNEWTSFVTAIPAKWLYDLYQQHKEVLFSANVREYLGSRKTDSNINQGIKETVENQPHNFWVFNNGITALVRSYKVSASKIKFEGISIVNGAQTTGAIGSLNNSPSDQVFVAARFITCSTTDVVQDIVRYNNSQNKVNPADFRSTDIVQERLRTEFRRDYGDAITYLGGRRGGGDDNIRRRRKNNHIPSDTMAQALTAFHGFPILAFQNKSEIWESDTNYSRVFNDNVTASHMVFIFSLHRTITEFKEQLKKIEHPTDAVKGNLSFLRIPGSTYMLSAAIGYTIETLINRSVPDKFKLRFKKVKALSEAMEFWHPIVKITIPNHLELRRVLEDRIQGQDDVRKALLSVSTSIQTLEYQLRPTFDEFSQHVEIK